MVRALALCTATCLVAASCGGGSPKLANHDQVYVVPAYRAAGPDQPSWSPDATRIAFAARRRPAED